MSKFDTPEVQRLTQQITNYCTGQKIAFILVLTADIETEVYSNVAEEYQRRIIQYTHKAMEKN